MSTSSQVSDMPQFALRMGTTGTPNLQPCCQAPVDPVCGQRAATQSQNHVPGNQRLITLNMPQIAVSLKPMTSLLAGVQRLASSVAASSPKAPHHGGRMEKLYQNYPQPLAFQIPAHSRIAAGGNALRHGASWSGFAVWGLHRHHGNIER